MPHHSFVAGLLLLATASPVVAQVDYERDIKPLLAEKCTACHGALKQEASLRLDAGKLILAGGDSGKAVLPRDATASLLLRRVSTEDIDERMPPEGEGEALNDEQLDLVTAWINAGAVAPSDEEILTSPKEHWAYKIPTRPEIPKVDDERWQHNPIDGFVAEQHKAAGVTSVDVAEKGTLARRLYFDLIGLPPTRGQLDAFINDDSEDSVVKLVNTLLDSPHYGERWGRHWMDVWRYSDWNGYKNQLRGSQRHIWRWRDWIIESLNEDKGYDQMIVEMLAGDEVAPDNLDVLRATGFLARNYHNSNRNIWLDATVEHTAKAFLGMTINCARCHDHKFDPIAQPEYYAMRAIFEPHNVRTERVPGQRNVMTDGVPRVFDAEPDAKTFVYLRGNEKHFDKESPVSANLPAIFDASFDPEPIHLPEVAVFPALWKHVEAEDLQQAKQRITVAEKQLATAQKKSEADSSAVKLATLRVVAAKTSLESLMSRLAADKEKYADAESEEFESLAAAAATAERTAAASAARLEVAVKESQLVSAETSEETDAAKKQATIAKVKKEIAAAKQKLKKAESALTNNDSKYTSVGKSYPRTSTGRRLALAKWIADSKNPLTARVAVNHIWMRHFGTPLVASTFDFGLRSPRPTHAKLLDWLAVELMENNWSMKHLHRLITTSRVYQLASSNATFRSRHSPSDEPKSENVVDSALVTRRVTATVKSNHPGVVRSSKMNTDIDPDNLLYWRANIRRLDAEVIRDSVLHVAGNLDLKQGGPDIDYAEGETNPRRSVYFRHAYEKQMTMLVLFDAAGPNECYRRSESIIPQQALTLANSSLSLSESRKLARSLWSEVEANDNADVEFVQLAFKQMLARSATDEETKACTQFLKQQASKLATPSSLTDFAGKTTVSVEASKDSLMRARENLIHVLMNHNDFVTVR